MSTVKTNAQAGAQNYTIDRFIPPVISGILFFKELSFFIASSNRLPAWVTPDSDIP